jgi:hypothetical protein
MRLGELLLPVERRRRNRAPLEAVEYRDLVSLEHSLLRRCVMLVFPATLREEIHLETIPDSKS